LIRFHYDRADGRSSGSRDWNRLAGTSAGGRLHDGAEGRITFYNKAAADLWGCRPELGSDRWCGSWRLYWPDGLRLPHDECPMAVALKEGRAVRGTEAMAERPDGTRVRFLPYPTPLYDAAGRLTGAINLLVDLTDRCQAEAMSARLAAIVASSDDAIISKTLDGKITSWNVRATRIFGYEESEMIGQSILRIIPPELHKEEMRILACLRRGERVDHYETVRVAKDGRRIDISLTVSPLRDNAGKVVGASKVARDITERKQSEKLQHLLVDELNHRVKNTLTMIQSIANQSLRHAKNPSDFVSGFSGRVQALARAHDLLTQTKMQGVELGELVREQVLIGNTDERRITYSGPNLMLDAQSTMHIALLLHELATNARKYGALSGPNGRLSIAWEQSSNGTRNLILEWQERGGPKVSVPKQCGFGSSLIERTLKGYGGDSVIRYAADGLSGRFTFPRPEQMQPQIGVQAVPRQNAAMSLRTVDVEPGLKGKRIIIIEDEPLVSMELEETLASAGCEVSGTAGNLIEAKLLSAKVECDAALIDVNLAGQPVDEIASTLIKRNIPFAFVSGYGRESLPEGFREAVLLRKPFTQDELVAAVELLLYQPPSVVQLRRK